MIVRVVLENGVKVLEPITADVESIRNNYFTTEIDTGAKWIDGKPIYRKVIDFGALPNNTSKAVAHNISNLGWVLKLEGISKTDAGTRVSLPFVAISDVTSQISTKITDTEITCTTGTNRSGYTQTYFIVEYTKTTD